MANNLYFPLPSRENFNNFHSTPNAVPWGKKEEKMPPVLHQKNVSEGKQIHFLSIITIISYLA